MRDLLKLKQAGDATPGRGMTKLRTNIFLSRPFWTASKRSRQRSGEQGDELMSIDFTQIFNIWFKPSSYHPPLPPSPTGDPCGERGTLSKTNLNR